MAPLRNLITKADNSIAPDRALYGDQYDIKIDALIGDVIALADVLDAGTGGSTPVGPAGGDLRTTYPNPIVKGLQSTPIVTTAPTDGQILTYDGITDLAWKPMDQTALSVNAGSIQGIAVSATPPTTGQILVAVGGTYTPTSLPLVTQNTLPVPASLTDYVSGSGGAAAWAVAGDTAGFGFTTIYQDEVLAGVSRGVSHSTGSTSLWIDGVKRPGWVLIQTSDNNSGRTRIWGYQLSGPLSDEAVWLSTSMDCISYTPMSTGVAYMTLGFANDDAMFPGQPDATNYFNLKVTATINPNEWTLESTVVQGAVPTVMGTITLISPTFPCPLVCLESRHSKNFVWYGLDKNSMSLAGEPFSGALTPEHVTIDIFSDGRPSTVFGFNQLIRTEESLM